jgi:cytoskeletal protein CcmA (bactofilin family)
VCGNVDAPIVVVNGLVTGNVRSSEHVELASNAIVRGDVEYSLIEMTKGAQVEGRLHFSGAPGGARDGGAVPGGEASGGDS